MGTGVLRAAEQMLRWVGVLTAVLLAANPAIPPGGTNPPSGDRYRCPDCADGVSEMVQQRSGEYVCQTRPKSHRSRERPDTA